MLVLVLVLVLLLDHQRRGLSSDPTLLCIQLGSLLCVSSRFRFCSRGLLRFVLREE